MIYRLIVKPLAEIDINDLYNWYYEQRQGLGDEFLIELERSIELIKSNPYQFQLRYKDVRMVKLKRFPVCLHLTISEQTIFVHAVLSNSRNPKMWEERN